MSIGDAGLGGTGAELSNFELESISAGPIEVDISVTNTLTVAHTIETWRAIDIINTADVEQIIFVTSPRVISVSNQAYVFQTFGIFNATFYVSVHNILNADQNISNRLGLFRLNVTNTANVSGKFIPRDLIINFSLIQNIDIAQRINLEHFINIANTADVAQSYSYLHFLSFSDTGTLTSTFTPLHQTYYLIANVNVLTNDFTYSGEYERDISQIQILKDTYRQIILVNDSDYSYDPYPVGPGQPPIVILPHPVVGGTPVISARQTILESSQSTVILPAAEYGDTFAAKVETTVKKTMTGKIFTYNKTNQYDKFTLTWVLGLKKSLELASVIEQNIQTGLGVFNFYVLTLWNGEIWYAKIVSTNIPITHEGRWQNSDNNNSEIEKMNVTIDFEGYRLL